MHPSTCTCTVPPPVIKHFPLSTPSSPPGFKPPAPLLNSCLSLESIKAGRFKGYEMSHWTFRINHQFFHLIISPHVCLIAPWIYSSQLCTWITGLCPIGLLTPAVPFLFLNIPYVLHIMYFLSLPLKVCLLHLCLDPWPCCLSRSTKIRWRPWETSWPAIVSRFVPPAFFKTLRVTTGLTPNPSTR